MNGLKFYLLLNAFLYAILTIWCLVKPAGTSHYLGYDFLNSSGKVEYLSIYVGLQFGFAVFLALCAFYGNLSIGGLIFCVSIYLGVMITRTCSALYYGNVSAVTFYVGALEYALGIWGIILLILSTKEHVILE